MNTGPDQDETNNPAGPRSVGAQRRQIPLLDSRIDSRDLFVGTREITIAHGEEIYRLRLTAQNKLILTK
ncbi:MAG: hemin uptake protein HemP [Pseudolabrys sp.]